MLGCLCIRKFERELGVFWRVILPRGRGVRPFLAWLGLDRFWLGWLGLDRFGLGLAWLGLDRFWLGLAWLGSFLAGLGLAWTVFGWAGLDRFWLGLVGLDRFWLGWVGSFLGLTKGWRKKSSNKFFACGAPDPSLTQF